MNQHRLQYDRIAQRYRPRPSAFPVQLFLSEDELDPPDRWVSWRMLAEDKLTVHILPGDHVTCIDRSAIAQLVKKIAHLLPPPKAV